MPSRLMTYLGRRLVAGERELLQFLARLNTTYPQTILCVCALATVLCVFYTARNLQFVTGRNDLIASDKRYLQLDEEYAREFMGIDQVVVVVEPRDFQQGKDFVSRLAAVLERDTTHVTEVFYRIDTSSLEGKKLLYLTPDDLRALRESLEEYRDLVRDLTVLPGLNTLFRAINQQVSTGMVSHLVSGFLGLDAPAREAPEERDPVQIGFLKSLLQEMARALTTPAYRYSSPWADFFGEADELIENDGYLVSSDRRFLFLMVEPRESEEAGFAEGAASIAAIRRAIAELRPAFPGLEAGVTGTKALDSDEALSAQTDAQVAAVVSFIGVTLLYLLFFRKLRHPLLIVTTLAVGLSWTMGFVTLTVGHLTIITVFVAPMLLGLADDFGVHFIARYEEERSRGQDVVAALHGVFGNTVRGISAGAFTTALAFAAVMLADFRGMQELGLIAGGGILLCLLATVTVLPACVMVMETYWPWKAAAEEKVALAGVFSGLGTAIRKGRWVLLALSGLLTLGALATVPTVSFDYNLLNLQAHGTESVEWELRIIAHSERSSRDALATASSPEEAMRKAAAFEALPSVETVESVAALIPTEQEERISLVRALAPLVEDLPPVLAAPSPVDLAALRRTLDSLRLKLREDNTEWDPQRKPAEDELREARQSLYTVIEGLQTVPTSVAQTILEHFQQELFRDFQEKWSLLRSNLNPPGPVTLADIPPQLARRFVSNDGSKFLLQIYPKKNVWEREPLEEFVTQLRQVDPDVTGSPIIGYESIRAIKDGYIEGGFYAFLAIAVVTFLTLRRVGDTLLALLPLSLGMIWTLGWMWLFGLQFNLANLVVVPLIIGIGIENGIHLVHRFREEGEGGPALVAGSTGRAVTLFSLTTMVGFGSLMVAQYYGIFSIGLLLTLAVGSVLVASLVVLPLLLFHAPLQGVGMPSAHPLPEESLAQEKRRASGRR
ncbi:MAG: MMPL family transporter [Candidatus Binatia bacterium]|nr:MMPL family transporter [Candidatus Binatia bacterium]